MAAGVPKEKSVEYLKMFGDMLKAGMSIDEMTYWRSLRELEKVESCASCSAIGLLHALAGKIDKANQVFEAAVTKYDDSSVPHNHVFVLRVTKQDRLLKDKVCEYADKYGTKFLTLIAFSYSYRFGDTERLIKYIDQHIKLLSDEEGRQLAERHKEELLSELNDAYSTTGCTSEQFELLALVIGQVAKDYDAEIGLVEVSRNNNGCYVADINNKDPKTIAEMNLALAEAVCMESRLDNCDLIGRFSPQRTLHTGVSYVSY